MPWSGGVYTRSNGVFTGATVWASDASVGTDITTAHHDTHDQDLATGLNNCVTIDGLNQIAASFVPDVDATYNLGAATFRWANVYVSGNVTGGTFVNSTLNAPALTGTVTGTYTLGGTPTLTSPTIATPTLSGTVAGTYTLGGTPTIASPTLTGTVTLSGTLASALPTASGGTGRTGVPAPLTFSTGGTNIAGGSIYYFGATLASTSESAVLYPVPITGTIKNMYAQASSAPGSGQTYAFGLRYNGSSTSLGPTISGTNTSQGADTTPGHAVSVSAGDVVDVEVVTSSAATTAFFTVTVEFDANP